MLGAIFLFKAKKLAFAGKARLSCGSSSKGSLVKTESFFEKIEKLSCRICSEDGNL